MEWSRENKIKLIQAYRERESLWNRKNPSFFRNTEKRDSWRSLAQFLGYDIDKVRRQMDSLLAAFRREKLKLSKMSNSKNAKRKSSWFAFEHMMFLLDKPDTQPCSTNCSSEDMLTVAELKENSDDDNMKVGGGTASMQIKTDIQETNIDNSLAHKPVPSEGIYSTIGYSLPEDTQILDILDDMGINGRNKDASDNYGCYVANKLRGYDPVTRSMAENQISNILHRADKEVYKRAIYTYSEQEVMCIQ